MTDPVRRHLEETGALLEGHFRLSSGLHSDRYLQCARVLMHPERAEELCRRIVPLWRHAKPEIVVGPAMGGITFAYELGRAFGVPAIFAERENGAFALRRGFAVRKGERVLIAEDVVTTGGSVQELATLLTQHGAQVVGVACLVQRCEKSPFQVPLLALTQQIFPTWTEAECPFCARGIPAVKPGSRPGAVMS